MRPSLKHFNKGVAFVPLSIGEHCHIGAGCVVQVFSCDFQKGIELTKLKAAQIGNYVQLGDNCIIGRRAVIKDCAILLPDSVLPPDSVIPPFSIYGGAPARPMGKVAESHQEHMNELTTSLYNKTKLIET